MYRVEKRLTPGLVGVASVLYGWQLWTRAKVRRRAYGTAVQCAGCNAVIPLGAFTFYPMTNALNRRDRLCDACVGAEPRAV